MGSMASQTRTGVREHGFKTTSNIIIYYLSDDCSPVAVLTLTHARRDSHTARHNPL